MPKTLLARSFLLIVILIVLSLSTSLFVFRIAEQEPRSQQMAQLIVSVVNLTRAAVLSAAPEWRTALLAELHDAEGMRVEMAEADDVITPLVDGPPEIQQMMHKVRAELGPDTHFAIIRNGMDALWVSFRIGSDEFWLALPHERIEQPISHVLLTWGVITLLLALLGAYLIARQVARPLRRLSDAAKQIGQGQTPLPLSEEGSQEIATVFRAFNQMSSDIAANARERALVLAGISHDLRTPLTRIRLAAELSTDTPLRDGLNADVTQMDEIIQQFLDYARLDELEPPIATDLVALVNETIRHYKEHTPPIISDLQALPLQTLRPQLLKRALSNLLDNAVKYGDGDIAVRLRQDGRNIDISVTDHGIGIQNEHIEAAKRPFVRLESARSDASGSGLGLAIVERTAKAHQGELILTAREGGGLVATLRLPISSRI
ncbi:MAG: ATP-binding protein [Gallionella sp.]|nr:ATP-binding protein [Gallionella sp.]